MIQLGVFHEEVRLVIATNALPLLRRVVGATVDHEGGLTLSVTAPGGVDGHDVESAAHMDMAEADRVIAMLCRARSIAHQAREDMNALARAARRKDEEGK